MTDPPLLSWKGLQLDITCAEQFGHLFVRQRRHKALLSIIYELEIALIYHSTRLFCTYECQRAFDSPSENG